MDARCLEVLDQLRGNPARELVERVKACIHSIPADGNLVPRLLKCLDGTGEHREKESNGGSSENVLCHEPPPLAPSEESIQLFTGSQQEHSDASMDIGVNEGEYEVAEPHVLGHESGEEAVVVDDDSYEDAAASVNDDITSPALSITSRPSIAPNIASSKQGPATPLLGKGRARQRKEYSPAAPVPSPETSAPPLPITHCYRRKKRKDNSLPVAKLRLVPTAAT